MMGVAARSHPADDLAIVPDRLVTDGVRALILDDERDQPQLRHALPVAECGLASDEIALAEGEEALQPGLERRIDRPILAGPIAEALLQPHRVQRTGSEIPQAQLGAGLIEGVIDRQLIVRRYPDLLP